eukprot:2035591-Alexandrium_andersonii.AAC.1
MRSAVACAPCLQMFTLGRHPRSGSGLAPKGRLLLEHWAAEEDGTAPRGGAVRNQGGPSGAAS